ncbi:DUF58 domain-containing protein [Bailinhaonella thermotolerans]|uniref:DUF58 domain-containing protein n=1 Tax=Bailinhaonella thermotolerans TaxID=1070861 RepID=A0A3A4AV55_9ACTN|nr:DUF58 domain-containing protein [Bailinhaonella thermotolerans]RJL34110.1 DUF58 domain-containing protein [Bailinhaonella thermotolerans]
MITRLGWGVLAASAVLYAGGAALGYPEPGVLAVAGLLAVAAAALWTLPRPRLEVRREVAPLRVARGEAAVAVLHVTNEGRARSGLRAGDRFGSRVIDVEVPRLPRRAARSVTYRLPTDRRGEIPVGPLTLERSDPLGLSRRTTSYGAAETLVVRPRTVPLPLLPSGRAHHLDGTSADNAPAGTVTFHTLREYVLGDDLRHVHWKSSARTGTLMVRQLVDATLPTTAVVLDLRPVAYDGDEAFELAVDAAASVAVAAARQNFPVRLLAAADTLLETKGGPADAEAILDRLALVAPAPGVSAMDVARRVAAGGALVVVSGPAADPADLLPARRRFDRVVCVRAGSAHRSPALPGVTVLDVPDLETLSAAWTRETR